MSCQLAKLAARQDRNEHLPVYLMSRDPAATHIYHITDVNNLPAVIHAGGLHSDAFMAARGGPVAQIGYGHIKQRRLNQYKVDCCSNRYVGEFVPFYFCPRSVMLFTINQGNTGLPRGSQASIVHLVSTVSRGIELGRQWAIADGNAGAGHTEFSSNVLALDELDWDAIGANYWGGRTHQKAAEFLVADFFPWDKIIGIGCHNQEVHNQVSRMVSEALHQPTLKMLPNWYY